MKEIGERVSVVIPLYNKERHIARAVESVLDQTYGDLELIVVDDGSTDASGAVAERIRDSRIRLIRQRNVGLSAARNRGIAEARTDLIAFLDADDEWLPEHLETIRRLSKEYPECGAYATTTSTVDLLGKCTVPEHDGIPAPPWEGVIPNYFRSATSYPVSASAVAIPRHVFDSVGLFPVGVVIGEDLDLWCRIALRYRFAFSTRVGAIYHKEADNRVLTSNLVLKEYSFIKVVRDALSTGVVPPWQRWDAFEFMAVHQLDVASNNIMMGDPRYARRLLRSCRGTKRYARLRRLLMLLASLPPGWPARLRAIRVATRKFAGSRS
jgi:glycosyltransferase involved in cell wall biosynthesis